MDDDTFSFDAALAGKKREEDAQREHGRRLYEWRRDTHTNTYIRAKRVSPEVESTVHQFLAEGGRIQPDRRIWIPDDHPYDSDIVIDESCVVSPPLPKSGSADSNSVARRHWEKERDKIRAEVTARWDTNYPRAEAMDFGYWEQEGPHETIWVYVDGQGSAWYFGSCPPNLVRVRAKLVEALHRQTP